MTHMSEPSRASCLECRRRKIKCDKSFPCSYCTKIRIECRYPLPRNRERHAQAQAGNSQNLDSDIISRIEKIERTLESFERSLSQISQLVLSSPSSLAFTRGNNNDHIERQNRCETSNRFIQWGLPNTPFSRPPETDPHNTPTCLDISPTTEPAIRATIILSLWQIFLERVDPVLKMIHVPTVQQKIMEAVRYRVPACIAFQTLISSICYSAAVTMSNEECRCKFNKEREDILGRYRDTVEDSLSLANFLHSTDMTVLQAFTIYIVCGRFDKQGPDVKSLVPIAVDIAQKNGLTRPHSDSMISPFENEMRRRIWWQLYTLDIRNAEDHDLEPCITEEPSATQKLPRSINDINIHPGMSEIPPSSSERTEMLFTLDRHEISTLARRVLFSDKFCQENSYPILSVSEKCNEIDKFQARIERQILSLCNTDIPVDFITVTSSRLVLAKLKLSVIKPKTRQNQHILMGEDFRYTCVEILKSARALRLYEEGKQYLWLFQTYLEWDALACLIINLCLVPSSHTTSPAWEAAEDIYEYWKSHSEVVFDGRWKQIESLRSQALLARRMYQDNPAFTGLWLVDSGDQANSRSANAVEIQGTSPGLLIEADANTLEPNPDVDSDIPVPTMGTACQWSVALFERYFQVLDSELNAEVVSWL